jgi:hypothetical protein
MNRLPLDGIPTGSGVGGNGRPRCQAEQLARHVTALVAALGALDVEQTPRAALAALLLAFAATEQRIAVRMATAAAEPPAAAVMGPDAFISVKQAAARLGVGPQWIYRRRARLPFVRRVGTRGVRVDGAALDRYRATRPRD